MSEFTVPFTSVTWTTGDTITEAKLDNMTANDQAFDAHEDQGFQLVRRSGDPTTPASTKLRLYAKDDGGATGLFSINEDGDVYSSQFPIGGIIMWSGSIATIPKGWLICDGNNGTPDLRDRFVVGAGSTYAVDATGGSADAVVVTHTHTQNAHSHTQNAHTHTQNSHNHTVYGDAVGLASGGLSIGTLATSSGGANKTSSSTTATNQNTTATNQNTTATNQNTGVSGTNANLPPYYALAYIMKV